MLDQGPVEQYFPINLRHARETAGLSQAELAERVKQLGHSCTQATIWKLEQGQREPKLAEAVALGRALGVRWTDLTTRPATFNAVLTVDQWRQRVYQLAEQTRAAAAAQIEALTNLAVAVHDAVAAGAMDNAATFLGSTWLEMTPEMTVLREVLAARVAWQSHDDERDRRMADEDRLAAKILAGLERSGVSLTIRPEDIDTVPTTPPAGPTTDAPGPATG